MDKRLKGEGFRISGGARILSALHAVRRADKKRFMENYQACDKYSGDHAERK